MYYLQSRYYSPNWGRFINADGYVSTGQGLLGNNMFVYCGNNPINRHDPKGTCWHYLWTSDCNKCARKKKNTISITGLFNAAVSTAANYTSAHAGNPDLAKELSEQLKIGNGYSSLGMQGAINELSKCEVTAGASIGFGPRFFGAQAGVGSISSIYATKDYAFVGANAGVSISDIPKIGGFLLPFNLAFDFDIRRLEKPSYITPGFSYGFGMDTFMGTTGSGIVFSTDIGLSYGANYYWVWERKRELIFL